jgi:hypothetical protein
MLEVATQPEPALPTPPQPAPQPAAAPLASPVLLAATSDLWLRVSEPGGAKLREGVMKAGERWEVPATAAQPQITTGRPEALRITVGATEIPRLGEPRRMIADVSLLPQDLLARVQGAAPAGATAPVQTAAVRPPAPRATPRQAAATRPAAPPAAEPVAAAPEAPAPQPAAAPEAEAAPQPPAE